MLLYVTCSQQEKRQALKPASRPLVLGARLQREGWAVQSLARCHSLPCALLFLMLAHPARMFLAEARAISLSSAGGDTSHTSCYQAGQNHSRFPNSEREGRQEMRCPRATG